MKPLAKLPIVNASDVQKNFKKIAEEVNRDGFRFVLNRGNIRLVMISLPLYEEKFGKGEDEPKKMPKASKKQALDKVFGSWGRFDQTTNEIMDEIRSADNNKTDSTFIKELLEWQKKNY